MKLHELIKILEEFQQRNAIRADTIIRDGQVILETDRAQSRGAADAYAYCLRLLEDLENSWKYS